MTETSYCLDSHPKIFFTIGRSIFSLQVYIIWQTFPQSRKFQRQFLLYWQSVSQFLLYPTDCLAKSFRKQEPRKIILPLKSSVVIAPWVLNVQFMKPSKQVQFLAQMANRLHGEPLQCPSFSWSSLMLPGTDVSHCHEKT